MIFERRVAEGDGQWTMTDNGRVDALQRRGVAERRSPAKEVMHRVRDGIMNMSRTHSSEQNDSRANQWEPHHAVQIPTQEKRRSLRGRSESDANETARTVLPRQRQVPVEMSSPMQQVSSQIRKKRASRNRQSNNMSVKRANATLRTGRRPHASKIPTASINPQGSRARGTQKSSGKAVGKTEQPGSSPPSVMGRLKGWIKRQTPFKDERSITDSRTGGTTSNDKSIYSHYVDSELDRLTPVPSHKLTRAHDFPLIDHSDEVSCEMPDNRSPSHFKDHRRGRSSRKSTKKPPTPHHWREQGSRLSVKESEFERNMALTFLCLRLQSIKVDEERLRRLENTLLSSGQPSLSAKEAMEWLLSHGDRIQQNARKASEKLRVVLADISIPVERAVKVLEIFVRNGTLFRKKHSEIKCTEFFGFRKIVSMDDITDILYHLAREQMYREFRAEDFIA